jgi:uncharacterized protein (TIGR03084 family)
MGMAGADDAARARYAALLTDLTEEGADLDRIVTALRMADWDRPTPASGWRVREQIAHLAYVDEMTVLAVTDPDGFAARRDADLADREAFLARQVSWARDLPPADLLARWRTARAEVRRALSAVDPRARIPWYGPPMSATSKATARLMETWAHGQEVADTVGATRRPTARLRHVAHLGVATRDFSFKIRGRIPPPDPVRVQLTSPTGGEWAWGDPGVADLVRGPALDFCLVVTQRRHVADTALEMTGPVATEWMTLAQAFAGPPGAGRAPAGRAPRRTAGGGRRPERQ